MKPLLFFSLLSSNIIFGADQQTHERQTAPGANLQELCINTIVANRIDSRILDPYLQSEIARKERLYLEQTQNRENERRRLIERLQEDNAYESFDENFQDDPDHISHLFPTLHNQYLTVQTTDSSFKKCLACLATKGITPRHCISYLGKGCIYSVGIGAALSPVIFVPTVICCPPMIDPILKGFLCFFASGITCSYLSKAARNPCNRYTQHCYDYLSDPGEAPRPIVMTEFLDPEDSLDTYSESEPLL